MKCSVCGKCFNTTSHLNQHMQGHIVRQQCRLCNQSFSFTANLRGHASEIHGLLPARRQTQTTFTCDICNKSFGKISHVIEQPIDLTLLEHRDGHFHVTIVLMNSQILNNWSNTLNENIP